MSDLEGTLCCNYFGVVMEPNGSSITGVVRETGEAGAELDWDRDEGIRQAQDWILVSGCQG